MKQIIQTHYKQRNINNTLWDFCINHALCTIQQNKLKLNL